MRAVEARPYAAAAADASTNAAAACHHTNQHAALAAPHTSKNELFRHSHAAVAVGRVAVTGKYHNDDAANASEVGDVVWGMWCG